MKYAIVNRDGLCDGFYADEIHNVIPDAAVPISEQHWRDFIDNQGFRRLELKDGLAVSVEYTPPGPTPEEIELARIAAIKQKLFAIDTRTTTSREWREYIIANEAQFRAEAVERAKAAEAEAEMLRAEHDDLSR